MIRTLTRSLWPPTSGDCRCVFGICSQPAVDGGDNQDAYAAIPDAGIYLVADGMGGLEAGGLASQIVTEVLAAELQRLLAAGSGTEGFRRTVEQALVTARSRLLSQAARQTGMRLGTTVAVAWVEHDKLHVAHLGDSRVYLYRGGRLRQLTEDQSLVQRLVEMGYVPAKEANCHPWRKLLLNYVGTTGPTMQLECRSVSLQPGDRIVMTTDGVTDFVDRDSIADACRAIDDPQQLSDWLVDVAADTDANDDRTCLVVAVD